MADLKKVFADAEAKSKAIEAALRRKSELAHAPESIAHLYEEVTGRPYSRVAVQEWLIRRGYSPKAARELPLGDVLAVLREAAAAKETRQPAGTEQPADSVAPSSVEMLLGDEGAAILEIVKSGKSADDRMREICALDTRYLGNTSGEWRDLLGPDTITDSAIRQTAFWRVDRPRLIGKD